MARNVINAPAEFHGKASLTASIQDGVWSMQTLESAIANLKDPFRQEVRRSADSITRCICILGSDFSLDSADSVSTFHACCEFATEPIAKIAHAVISHARGDRTVAPAAQRRHSVIEATQLLHGGRPLPPAPPRDALSRSAASAPPVASPGSAGTATAEELTARAPLDPSSSSSGAPAAQWRPAMPPPLPPAPWIHPAPPARPDRDEPPVKSARYGKDTVRDKGKYKGKDTSKGKDSGKDKGGDKSSSHGKDSKSKNSAKSQPYARTATRHGIHLIPEGDRGWWCFNSDTGWRQFWSTIYDDWIRCSWED